MGAEIARALWSLLAGSGLLAVGTGEIRVQVPPSFEGATICVEATPMGGGVRAPKSCGTVEERRATLRVPSGRWDLRLHSEGHVEGHAPVYVWDLSIDEGEAVDLGLIEPIPGASIAGWIVGSDESARIEIVSRPKVFGWLGDPTQRRKVDRLEARTTATKEGFFQLAGLRPGIHDLKVRFGEGSEATLAEIELERGEAISFESPFVVEPPRPLRVFVDPPTDGDGEEWTFDVSRQLPKSTVVEKVETGRADLAGAWSSRPLGSGIYRVEVSDSAGSDWHSGRVEIGPGSDLVEIRLEVHRIHGELRLGDEPLAAEIVFGTMNRRPRIFLRSDEDGEFRGLLPRAGEWQVEVAVEDDFFAVEPIEIDPDEDPAEVTIELPDTTLAGKVTRAGRPVESAIVTVRRTEDRQEVATARTGEDGAFRLRGLAEGEVAASALDGRDTSDWAFVQLLEGREENDLRLEIAPRRAVRGQLRHRGVPVIGAEIDYTVGDMAFMPHPSRATTDLDGRFELFVPLDTRHVEVLVSTPAATIHVGRLDWRLESLETSESVELAPWDLPDTLTLRLPIDPASLTADDPRWIVTDRGAVAASVLANLALRLGTLSAEDGAFWIRGLGLAEYQVCQDRQGPCRPAQTRSGDGRAGEPLVSAPATRE